jgi:hypothetical protein
MTSSDAPAARTGALTAAVEFARRSPGKVLAIALGLHLLLWTVIPPLICPNLQLDLVEDLALGKEWQFGYWKHPPLPWWIADALYQFTGRIDSVYVLGPLAAVICFYGVWLLARDILGAFVALLAVFALEGVHFYNFSVVKFAHDQAQLPFWAFTGFFFYRALTRGRMRDWMLAGISLGGAFWSKYAVFVLAVTLALFLIVDPAARRAWRTPGPFLMAIAFAVVIAPNVWWLVDHNFMPVRYVDARARAAAHWFQYATFSVQWIGSQALNLLPTGALMAVLYKGCRIEDPKLTEEAAFDRRYVAWLALGPFLATTLLFAVAGRLPIAMWGYPLWSFAPLALLTWFRPVADARALRRFAAGFIVLLIGFPILYVGVEIGEPFLRDRPKATQFPGQLLADIVTHEWHKRYGTPLVYVSGSEFGSYTVAVYSPDRPHVIVHGELKLSPWINADDLRRHGAVLVWDIVGDFETFKASIIAGFTPAFGNIEFEPMLALPRQTWHPVSPAHIVYAFVPPQP